MGFFNFIIIPEETDPPARWIGLKKATKYSSIGQKRLISLAESRKITGFRDPENKRGDWIFDKESIDEYRLNQFTPKNDRKKILRIMQGVG